MKRALVLSGGGAKGAWQAGALMQLEAYGYTRWDAGIFGVSVGALNGAGLAVGGVDLLGDVWAEISEQDVFKRYSWPTVALRFLQRKPSIYDHAPLLATIRRHLGDGPYPGVRVGVVSLNTGQYYSLVATANTVWASATMPVYWPPVGDLVDGGLRNCTPLSEAINAPNPADEIVIIECNPAGVEPSDKHGILNAPRSLDIALDEVAEGKVDTLLRINELVLQAGRHNLALVKPDGSLYRHVEVLRIRPTTPQGDTLDFSQTSRRARQDNARRVVDAILAERMAA